MTYNIIICYIFAVAENRIMIVRHKREGGKIYDMIYHTYIVCYVYAVAENRITGRILYNIILCYIYVVTQT